jgi:hypothetical protein
MSKRNYKLEYANYQGKPEQIKNRSMRNQARAAYEKANGNLPSKVDVDHQRPLIKGGSNSTGNLRAVSQRANRSFARTRQARMK